MDFLAVLETFGVPITMCIAFGFFIWKQNKFIQEELQKELRESFARVEGIIIKLIDAQKTMQMNQKEIMASYRAKEREKLVIVGEKIIEIAIKAIAKKFKLTKILEYVEKPNDLDKSVDRLFSICQSLEARITDIEKYYHNRPPRCKCEAKEKEGKWYDK
jgi:hypothetical protein